MGRALASGFVHDWIGVVVRGAGKWWVCADGRRLRAAVNCCFEFQSLRIR